MGLNFDIVQWFSKYLGSEDFLNIARLVPTAFTRDRKMGFVDLMWFMLTRGEDSLEIELDKYADKAGIEPIARQSFTESRQDINPLGLKHLNTELVSKIYEFQEYETYKDHLLVGIDGMLVDLPWINEFKDQYGGTTNKNKEITAIKAKSSGMYDCLNKTMIDFEVKPYTTDERELAYLHLENTAHLQNKYEIIVIFDRNYASLELFNYLDKIGIKFICRLKKEFYKKEKELMTSNDEYIDIYITKARLYKIKDDNIKEELKKRGKFKLRLTKIQLENDTEEELISNLPLDIFSTDEMKKLYNQRWKIETAYDALKNTMAIEKLTSKKPLTLEQDLHSKIISYNLSEDIVKQANEELQKSKKN